MDYQAYSVSNFRKIPQLEGLNEEIKHDIEIVGHILPFKVNNFCGQAADPGIMIPNIMPSNKNFIVIILNIKNLK